MKKILRLFSVQVFALLGDMFSIGNSRKKKKPKALYAGILLFVIMMSSIAFFYCYMIGRGLMLYDSIEILPPMIMAATSVIVLLTTIFKVKGTIFGFRDYDLIMSLPVSTGGIVASRVMLLYSINFAFVMMIMVPMMAAYGLLAKPGIMFYLTGTLMMFFVPLVPIILASVLGTLVAFASARFRHSNMVSILISILALVSFIGLFSLTAGNSGEEMINISNQLTKQVNSIYPLADLYTKAINNGDSMALLSFLLISLGAFFLYSYLIGKLFRKLNSLVMAGKRSAFKMGELRTATPLKALFRKEIKRYFSSPIYVLNTGIGVILLTIGAIASFFVDLEKLAGNPQVAGMFSQGGALFVSFCIVTSCTTMASVSIEGRNLWIVKSLPVPAGTIFASKLLVNLVITAPAMIDAILIAFALKQSFTEGLILVLVVVVMAVFVSLMGLVINLKFPNFTWTSETVVVKQSAATMISLFGGFIIVGLQVLFLVVIKAYVPAYLLYLGIMSVAVLLLYRILMSYGVKRFQEL